MGTTPCCGQRLGASSSKDSLGVHFCGPLAVEALKVSVVPGKREYPDDIECAANAHWKAAVAKKPNMFDGNVWCLISYESREKHELSNSDVKQELHVTLQSSNFRYMLYTHMSAEGQALPLQSRCGACGLMSLTQTKDGFLVIGQRSLKIATMPGYWHCIPAGQVDSEDLVGVVKKELLEETGVEWSLVERFQFIALMDTGNEQGNKNEFVFKTQLALSADELYKSYNSAEDRFEHADIIFVAPNDNSPSARRLPAVPMVGLDEFLTSKGKYTLTDVTRRALMLLWEIENLS